MMENFISGYVNENDLPNNTVIGILGSETLSVCYHNWEFSESTNAEGNKFHGQWHCFKCGITAMKYYEYPVNQQKDDEKNRK